MKRLLLIPLLCLGLASSPTASASSYSNNNPMVTIMAWMLDAFEALAEKRWKEKLDNGLIANFNARSFSNPAYSMGMPYSSAPWQHQPFAAQGFPGSGLSGYQPRFWALPNSPQGNIPSPYPNPLNGYWVTNSGMLFFVRQSRARLYRSETDYQDFYLQTSGQWLYLRDAYSGNERQYRYHQDGNKMLMQDIDERLLLLKRFRTADGHRQ